MMCAVNRTPVGIVLAAWLALFAAITVTGCSAKENEPKSAVTTPQAGAPAASDSTADEPLPPLAYESALPGSRAFPT